MGKRGKQPWSRQKLPVGTVRIRRDSPRVWIRMIKVADTGPRGRRWIALARHWWLTHRGPVPRAMRVIHRDGHTLNDDPGNYALVDAGQVLRLARAWDPGLDARNRAAARAGTAQCNWERGRVRRATSFLPGRWYPVDPVQRIVVNEPFRSRIGLYRRFAGDAGAQSPNGAGFLGRWLGWPGLTGLQAAILRAVADSGGADLPAIMEGVVKLRALHGCRVRAPLPGAYRTAISGLRRRNLVASLRVRGRRRVIYYSTPQAADRPGRGCRFLAVRGRHVLRRFPGVRKIWPDQVGAIVAPAVSRAGRTGRGSGIKRRRLIDVTA